jgi:hypothetical protein
VLHNAWVESGDVDLSYVGLIRGLAEHALKDNRYRTVPSDQPFRICNIHVVIASLLAWVFFGCRTPTPIRIAVRFSSPESRWRVHFAAAGDDDAPVVGTTWR